MVPGWGRARPAVGYGEPRLYLIGHWDPPKKVTFLSRLDLGPRRAAPLDPPWVASVGPKVHTGIGVGPGPAGPRPT